MAITRPIAAKSSIAGLILLLLLAPGAAAQTVMPTPFQTFLDNAGHILPLGCVWTYTAGTTTAATTYTTASLGTPNANPIIADAYGRFVAFLAAGQSYKFVYESTPCSAIAHGTVLRTVDNVSTVPSGSVNVDVQGTAGEALAAGAAVYLSDGSGGTVAGQWYNASSTNAYSSSSAPQVGMAPSAVLSGATGTFRIAGRIASLSGLTAGAYVYVGATAGTYTTTAPANARVLGPADSTTSLLVGQTLNVTTQPIDVADERLTCTTAVAVTITDCTAVTALYVTPFHGNRIALFNGSGLWFVRTFTEITVSVTSCSASKPYDIFLYDNAGTVTAEQLVWTSATARATALVLQNGVYVKSGATTRRYIGTYFCNASAGQTDDSGAKRYLYNYYHRVPRQLLRADTGTWTYTTATWRQANANVANQVEVMIGVNEDAIDLSVFHAFRNSSAGVVGATAIGLDSTTTPATGFRGTEMATAVVDNYASSSGRYNGYVGVGWHKLVWLETVDTGTGTMTWTSGYQDTTGLSGTVLQ